MPYSEAIDVEYSLGKAAGYFTASTKPTLVQVQEFISRADAFIDGLGHDWNSNAQVDEYKDGYGNGVIKLNKKPILSITTLEYWNGSEWVACVEGKDTTSDGLQHYEVYQDEGIIKLYSLRLVGIHMYRINYTYGYESLPTYVKELSAILAALKVLSVWSSPTMSGWNMGDMRVQYPEGGEYGVMWKDLMSQAATLFAKLGMHRPLAATG